MARKKYKKLMKAKLLKVGIRKYHSDFGLNWKQAKRKYPKLKPYHDSDFDGTLNSKDCRPLNPAMDARKKKKKPSARVEVTTRRIQKWGKKRAGGQMSGKVMKLLSGQSSGGQQKVKSGPGRPAGVFKHISPITGKSVPATVFYKHRKELRRRLRSKAAQSNIQEQAVMARRGVPPQITRMRQMQRIQQQVPQETEEYEEEEEEEEEVPQQIQIQQQRPYRVVTDIMTGRRIIKSIPPQERWTMKGG